MPGPDGHARQTIQDFDPVYLNSVLGSISGITNSRQGSVNDAGQEILNNVFGAFNANADNGRAAEAVFNTIFSQQNGRPANMPPSYSSQTYTTGNSMYTGEANNVPPPTPTQAQQSSTPSESNDASLQETIRLWEASGGNAANVSSQTSQSPRSNGPGTPSSPFAAPADARGSSRGDSTFTMSSSFARSFNGTGSTMNTQPSRAPTSPAGRPENGQGQLNFQYPDPNTIGSPSQSFQFVHVPFMSVQPSPFPNTGNSAAQPFQSTPQIPSDTNLDGNGARAVNGSILLERPMTRSPPHDDAISTQQGNAAPAADAPPPEAAINEALTKTPLEKRAGFLGF
ncbi:hypothetical protein F5887DRAFT_921269 [Amanita rubescens]|nr:hypothetical protein F5887DRAFT_921269 [Amanita rubescens]